jgi:type IV pilus assembly protein PilW
MSLIELMISIALGLLILAAATAMTVKSLVMNTDTLTSVKLNQDLDAVTQVMVNEIRRAGFTGGAFFYADNQDLNIVSNSCVLYAYDANENATTDAGENLGFKLVGSEIHMRTSCTGSSCPTDCSAGTWVPITDDTVMTITNLNFHSSKSKCISITDSAHVATGNTNNYWVTNESTSATQFPCMATSGTGLTTYALNTSDVYTSPSTFVAPQVGDRLIEARLVNVEVDASLANDNAVTKSQEVEINVRNDHLRCIKASPPHTCP